LVRKQKKKPRKKKTQRKIRESSNEGREEGKGNVHHFSPGIATQGEGKLHGEEEGLLTVFESFPLFYRGKSKHVELVSHHRAC